MTDIVAFVILLICLAIFFVAAIAWGTVLLLFLFEFLPYFIIELEFYFQGTKNAHREDTKEIHKFKQNKGD